MAEILPLTHLRPERFDRPRILKQLNAASRQLAELKGVAASMPNQHILISTLGLREAKDSSEKWRAIARPCASASRRYELAGC